MPYPEYLRAFPHQIPKRYHIHCPKPWSRPDDKYKWTCICYDMFYLKPPHLPRPTADLFSANRLPMLPKHTQLQNKTLSTHIPVSIVLSVAKPPNTVGSPPVWPVWFRCKSCDEYPIGAGIISWFNPSATMEPARPTAADNKKPGLDRSIRYHRNGLTAARVIETCIVEAQGTFLWKTVSWDSERIGS